MTSYAARRVNRDIRNRDRLTFQGVLADPTEWTERAQSGAMYCPHCTEPTKVYPSRIDEHMALYHKDILTTTAFYESLDAETRVTLQAYKREINDKMRIARDALVSIGERLLDAKARLPHGKYLEWVRLEWNWSERAAQRFVNVYTAYKNDKLSPLLLQKSALYILAAPSTPPSARQFALDKAVAGERLSVEETALMIARHKDVQTVVTAYNVTHPDTVQLLDRIVNTDSFNEIRDTGYLQSGDAQNAVHVTDDPRDLQAALLDKSGQYRHEAAVSAEPIPQPNIMQSGDVFLATLNLGEYPDYAAAQKAITAVMTRLYAERATS